MTDSVHLGYIVDNKDNAWRLLSHYFPSKVGGKPAWLAFTNLPSEEQLKCRCCGRICIFLLQLYAPIDSRPTCFHRTIFIFICKNPECCKPNRNDNILVFRCQLPRKNDFYPETPADLSNPGSNENYPHVELHCNICSLCGCFADKKCSGCHKVSYCSKAHQVLDWSIGGHKQVCRNETTTDSKALSLLFKEYELDYDVEDFAEECTEDEDEENEEGKSESERLAEYAQFLRGQRSTDAIKNVSVEELESMAAGKKMEDKNFSAFRKRIKSDPEQVLRYQRGGEPLWITDESIPTAADIPPCQYCNEPRQFEFQVMPQLLRHLDVDSLGASIDWGTIVIYTCAKSCDSEGNLYKKEFVWKQDFSNR